MTAVYDLIEGESPLIVSIPHCGTTLPPGLIDRLSPPARLLPDTDWHVERLYDFARGLGATVIAARLSRFVIDLNRPADGASLYPGQATTGLCPTTLFSGVPLYLPGAEPTPTEIAARVENYWRPYHRALAGELARLKARHGHAILYDAHSIRAEVPRLFEGRLPDLNLGTAGGASLSPAFAPLLDDWRGEAEAAGFTTVLNGRFIGGHITRAYGQPADNIHALQMELVQQRYMDEESYAYLPERADRLRPLLHRLLDQLIAWRP
ncbi:N-formylglutamate deformylase [Rhodospirillum rubrum]|uniref:N-formylglutamate deformylase n=1 Tax=Rhodospirillum rubrum (strain ATCC 11170 / ATH 1.1.1 / DSM 467 / LMG 4362 / NCIMB 8255 / S1) TaxID=269796 RepID=Q2RUU4_RHORT|nr:N-formylglutamate deformylase [Rhodospirillum rubrum]ABC22101.1 N-formylglutamate deformylase [Rhodospirillum rubrum ATCC 11170]AEO47815.1 N-formylglutamate deformylase [Rhodospirillum rubrum F11]MBK5953691.1 N-formylglutamate deformylase [Rhodospirillum rubrum]QXG81751.1 N-formylglutamate deformylase [Rhodospirillum rubrum]HAQ00355.1 N-formylglutamate deformylase [Rhodospirillum rubrum]